MNEKITDSKGNETTFIVAKIFLTLSENNLKPDKA